MVIPVSPRNYGGTGAAVVAVVAFVALEAVVVIGAGVVVGGGVVGAAVVVGGAENTLTAYHKCDNC